MSGYCHQFISRQYCGLERRKAVIDETHVGQDKVVAMDDIDREVEKAEMAVSIREDSVWNKSQLAASVRAVLVDDIDVPFMQHGPASSKPTTDADCEECLVVSSMYC